MLKKRLFGVIVAGVVIVMMTGAASFAATAQHSISDPKSDQVLYGSKPSLAQKKQADIVKVTYGRGATRVRVRVRMRDLSRQVRLPRIYFHGMRWAYVLQWYPGLGSSPQLLNPSRQEICPGKGSLDVDYSANVIEMGVPKSCFPKGYLIRKPTVEVSYTNAKHTMEIDDGTERGNSFYPNPN